MKKKTIRTFETLEARQLLAADFVLADIAQYAPAVPDALPETLSDQQASAAKASTSQTTRFDVTDYGVVADSNAVQTSKIQSVLNLAAKTPGSEVFFPPGKYVTGSLRIPQGIAKMTGYGAVMVTKPLAAGETPDAWLRVFNVTWTGSGEKNLTIEGFEFDMNRTKQGWLGGHHLEHQAGIFLSGGTAAGNPLNVTINNVFLHDGVGDGIYVHHNVNASISDVNARDIFRGALTITGNKSNVLVHNFRAWGDELQTGMDIEPNHDTDQVHVQISNSQFLGRFDVALTPGSTFKASNVVTSGYHYLYNYGGNFMLSDSTVNISTRYHIRFVGTSTFDNVDFVLSRNTAVSSAQTIRGVTLEWEHGNRPSTNQQMTFNNSRFTTDGTVRGIDYVEAIYGGVDSRQKNNLVIVQNTTIRGAFDVGVTHNRGGNYLIQNSYIDADIAFKFQSINNYYYNATLIGNTIGSNVKWYWVTTFDNPNNTVTHVNTILKAEQNVLAGTRAMNRSGENEYMGSRTIYGKTDPTKVSTPGFLGDIFIVSPTERWICVRGDYGAAVWQKMTV